MKKSFVILLAIVIASTMSGCGPCGIIPQPKPTIAAPGPAQPTADPTAEPTAEPTAKPTEAPTEEPTAEPTEEPTAEPTATPTAKPTRLSQRMPSATAEPPAKPTAEPTEEPTTIAWVSFPYSQEFLNFDDSFKEELGAGPKWGSNHFACNHPIWGFVGEIENAYGIIHGGSMKFIRLPDTWVGRQIKITYEDEIHSLEERLILGSLKPEGEGRYTILEDATRVPWLLIRDQMGGTILVWGPDGQSYAFNVPANKVGIFCPEGSCSTETFCPRSQ